LGYVLGYEVAVLIGAQRLKEPLEGFAKVARVIVP